MLIKEIQLYGSKKFQKTVNDSPSNPNALIGIQKEQKVRRTHLKVIGRQKQKLVE